MWDVHRNVDLDAVPPGRTVLRFRFRDVPGAARSWWLVITADGVDLCDFDPDHPVTATVESDLRTSSCVWRGDLSWSQALRSGDLELHGPAHAPRRAPLAAVVSLRPRPQADLAACQAVAK